MTMVKGGVAYNVIPAEMDVSFDLRIPPTVNLQVCRPAAQQAAGVQGHLGRWTHAHSFVVSNPRQEFERQIKEWCKEAGEDITYEFAQVCERGAARNVIPPLAWG